MGSAQVTYRTQGLFRERLGTAQGLLRLLRQLRWLRWLS